MKWSYTVLILAACLVANAQEIKHEFGDISNFEMQLKTYDKDPDAEAVILFDLGQSKFIDKDGGYNILFSRHQRIKIFSKNATDLSEYSISYYVDGFGKTEEVKSIKATSYTYKNGQIIRQDLDLSSVFEERINESWRNKKFVVPNVQEGSIIEIKYEIETPFHFNLPDWKFQSKIPTLYSQYEVHMIPFYEYIFLAQGITKFDHQRSVVAQEKRSWGNISKSYGKNVGTGFEFSDYVHTYALKNIPAFKDESYITSSNDYIIKMDFQLAKFHKPNGGTSEIISTWPKLNGGLLKNERFGKYQKSCDRFSKKILEDELKLSGLSYLEKSKLIIEYVKSNFIWNGYQSKYSSQSAKDFYTSKSGNSADINLFLISLLNAAEIDATPVILSSRNHGKISGNYPFDHFTNYVIIMVKTESTSFLCDGTEELLPYDRLPFRCFNEKGLIVTKDQENWIKLVNNIPSIEKNIIKLNVNEETKDVEAKINIQLTEYDAYNYRRMFKNDTSAIKNFYDESLNDIKNVQLFNYSETSKALSLNFQGTYESEKIGENIIFNPFLGIAITENNLTQKTRNYPIDFIYSGNEIYDISFSVPEGYKISELPDDFKMDNDLAEINLFYDLSEEKLQVNANYLFKKSIYSPGEYARVKYYLDTIVKKFNEPIVLERI